MNVSLPAKYNAFQTAGPGAVPPGRSKTRLGKRTFAQPSPMAAPLGEQWSAACMHLFVGPEAFQTRVVSFFDRRASFLRPGLLV